VSSNSDRTELAEELTRTIDNIYIYIQKKVVTRKLIQALNHDSGYDYERIREIAQSPRTVQNPTIRSNFNDC
jgi:hypothetical protein